MRLLSLSFYFQVFISALVLNASTASASVTDPIDFNNNSFSDIWEDAYAVSEPLTPNTDADSDGRSNGEEAIAGTNPLDATDYLSVRNVNTQHHRLLLRWNSKPGASYYLQHLPASPATGWVSLGGPISGHGGSQWTAVDAAQVRGGLLRIARIQEEGALTAVSSVANQHDTDGDGQSDIFEFFGGTDPLSAMSRFAIDTITFGASCELEWQSQPGKFYQVESSSGLSSTSWQREGSEIYGSGETIRTTINVTGKARQFFRLSVRDTDSDLDGLTDWEEYQMDLDPTLAITALIGPNDREFVENNLALPISLSIRAASPIASRDDNTPGKLIISRTGSPAATTVHYQVNGNAVPGTDYAALAGVVQFAFGQNEAELWVTPLSGPSSGTDPSVIVSLSTSPNHVLEGSPSASVTLFKKRAISVTSFGATGDGITDDTVALQAAIHALETSPIYNTLYFPPGTYRVDQFYPGSETATSRHRILHLGTTDLAGRDLLIEGAPGSRIYSTVSPTRAHILETRVSFRTLSFRGMTFEKDPVVLTVPLVTEPNGADGVSLVQVDARKVEAVVFQDCTFVNCHGAVRSYGGGYDTRGKLANFQMNNCNVSNPWGANCVAAPKIWGGGQQVTIDSWIGYATYRHNHFDGGSAWQDSPELNPLARKKDGCHFGSPLNLDFIENLVEGMAVEAVYQLHAPLLGHTSTPLSLPAVGQTATAVVSSLPSTYQAGQLIAIRGPVGPSGVESLPFTIAAYASGSRQLSIRNEGLNPRNLEGLVFPSGAAIYLQGNNAGRARIERNIVRGSSSGGPGAAAGIVADASAIIRDNYLEGHNQGVLIYGNPRTPLFPGSRGNLIERNLIVAADTTFDPGYQTYGIHSWGPDEIIRDNLILMPLSSRVVGIALRGRNATVQNNTIVAMNIRRNGYESPIRATGVGVGNSSLDAWIARNTTYGFDIGVGPVDKFQSIPHYVIDHRSLLDELPIDPRGVILNE
jgi:hypothetical protein